MKTKCFFFIALLLSVVSCSIVPINSELIDLGTPEEAAAYIKKNIHFVADDYRETGKLDDWTLPKETNARGWGDCDDAAILFASALTARGYYCELVAVFVKLKYTSGFHMVVEFNGKWYSPQSGFVDDIGTWPEWGRWSYQDALNTAKNIF